MTMTSIPASSASPPNTSAAVSGLQPWLRSGPGWSAHAMAGVEMAAHINVRAAQRAAPPREPGVRLDNLTATYLGRSAIPWGALPTGIERTWVCVARSMTET